MANDARKDVSAGPLATAARFGLIGGGLYLGYKSINKAKAVSPANPANIISLSGRGPVTEMGEKQLGQMIDNLLQRTGTQSNVPSYLVENALRRSGYTVGGNYNTKELIESALKGKAPAQAELQKLIRGYAKQGFGTQQISTEILPAVSSRYVGGQMGMANQSALLKWATGAGIDQNVAANIFRSMSELNTQLQTGGGRIESIVPHFDKKGGSVAELVFKMKYGNVQEDLVIPMIDQKGRAYTSSTSQQKVPYMKFKDLREPKRIISASEAAAEAYAAKGIGLMQHGEPARILTNVRRSAVYESQAVPGLTQNNINAQVISQNAVNFTIKDNEMIIGKGGYNDTLTQGARRVVSKFDRYGESGTVLDELMGFQFNHPSRHQPITGGGAIEMVEGLRGQRFTTKAMIEATGGKQGGVGPVMKAAHIDPTVFDMMQQHGLLGADVLRPKDDFRVMSRGTAKKMNIVYGQTITADTLDNAVLEQIRQLHTTAVKSNRTSKDFASWISSGEADTYLRDNPLTINKKQLGFQSGESKGFRYSSNKITSIRYHSANNRQLWTLTGTTARDFIFGEKASHVKATYGLASDMTVTGASRLGLTLGYYSGNDVEKAEKAVGVLNKVFGSRWRRNVNRKLFSTGIIQGNLVDLGKGSAQEQKAYERAIANAKLSKEEHQIMTELQGIQRRHGLHKRTFDVYSTNAPTLQSEKHWSTKIRHYGESSAELRMSSSNKTVQKQLDQMWGQFGWKWDASSKRYIQSSGATSYTARDIITAVEKEDWFMKRMQGTKIGDKFVSTLETFVPGADLLQGGFGRGSATFSAPVAENIMSIFGREQGKTIVEDLMQGKSTYAEEFTSILHDVGVSAGKVNKNVQEISVDEFLKNQDKYMSSNPVLRQKDVAIKLNTPIQYQGMMYNRVAVPMAATHGVGSVVTDTGTVTGEIDRAFLDFVSVQKSGMPGEESFGNLQSAYFRNLNKAIKEDKIIGGEIAGDILSLRNRQWSDAELQRVGALMEKNQKFKKAMIDRFGPDIAEMLTSQKRSRHIIEMHSSVYNRMFGKGSRMSYMLANVFPTYGGSTVIGAAIDVKEFNRLVGKFAQQEAGFEDLNKVGQTGLRQSRYTIGISGFVEDVTKKDLDADQLHIFKTNAKVQNLLRQQIINETSSYQSYTDLAAATMKGLKGGADEVTAEQLELFLGRTGRVHRAFDVIGAAASAGDIPAEAQRTILGARQFLQERILKAGHQADVAGTTASVDEMLDVMREFKAGRQDIEAVRSKLLGVFGGIAEETKSQTGAIPDHLSQFMDMLSGKNKYNIDLVQRMQQVIETDPIVAGREFGSLTDVFDYINRAETTKASFVRGAAAQAGFTDTASNKAARMASAVQDTMANATRKLTGKNLLLGIGALAGLGMLSGGSTKKIDPIDMSNNPIGSEQDVKRRLEAQTPGPKSIQVAKNGAARLDITARTPERSMHSVMNVMQGSVNNLRVTDSSSRVHPEDLRHMVAESESNNWNNNPTRY